MGVLGLADPCLYLFESLGNHDPWYLKTLYRLLNNTALKKQRLELWYRDDFYLNASRGHYGYCRVIGLLS
jgi:hypothetical protein